MITNQYAYETSTPVGYPEIPLVQPTSDALNLSTTAPNPIYGGGMMGFFQANRLLGTQVRAFWSTTFHSMYVIEQELAKVMCDRTKMLLGYIWNTRELLPRLIQYFLVFYIPFLTEKMAMAPLGQ